MCAVPPNGLLYRGAATARYLDGAARHLYHRPRWPSACLLSKSWLLPQAPQVNLEQFVAMGPCTDGWTKDQVLQVLQDGRPADLLYVPVVVGMSAPDSGEDREAAGDIRHFMRLATFP